MRDIPKYAPFVRIDYKYWSYFVLSFTEILFWPRFFIGWSIWFFAITFVIFYTSCHKEGTPYKKWQLYLTQFIGVWGSGLLIKIFGYYWSTSKQVKVDYSKWLGSDYKYVYNGAGIYICNHNSPFDLMLLSYTMPRYVSFLGKEES